MTQKKIIALAVAGLVSGAAFAQSNVTVYGVMDAGFYSWWGEKNGAVSSERSTGIASHGRSTSRLGFRGVENLGDGLTAKFNLEGSVSLDNPGPFGFNRQSNVALQGRFGELTVGVQSTVSDSWNWRSGIENLGNQSARYLLAGKTFFASQKTEGITYYTPEFKGLTIGAATVFLDKGGEKRTTTGGYKVGKSTDERSTLYELGARCVNGPFVLAATAAVNTHDLLKSRKQYTLGSVYDFGFVRVQGIFERVKTGSDYQPSYVAPVGAVPARHATWGQDVTRDLWSFGLSFPLTQKDKIHMGYSLSDFDSYLKGGVKQKKINAKGYMLGYQHIISKRSEIYAAYSFIDNEKNATFSPNPGYGKFTAASGRDYNGFIVGIRHAY